MELLLEAAMEHKVIAQLGNFATPTVCVLIYVRNIQPKAMVMEPKEIAKLENFVTPTVHVLTYALKMEY